MAENELIVIKQLPVIEEQFRLAGEEVQRRVSEADALVCTEESKQAVKKARAELNKEYEVFKGRFKIVEAEILAPWSRVKEAYKQFVSDPYKEGDERLKAKIDAIEVGQKKQLRDGVETYFAEYLASKNIDFITFDNAGIKVGVSDNPTNLKKQAAAFIDRVCDDIALIDTQENKEEILVEYRRSLNASQAITTVTARHKAIEEQKARQAEAKARRAAEQEVIKRVEAAIPEPLTPPVVKPAEDYDPVRTLSFKVTAPLSMLRKLKKFLDDGGYNYE